ncbi:MAG: bifunctional homocysteine S-methyltransferase/methylenetetrahydrofolate reductase [Aggregatilineales bacterium]
MVENTSQSASKANSAFLKALKSGETILADGAMGTILHQRGAEISACFDALNLSDPDLVAGVHRDYIEAGANLIETNTFGANRYKLTEYGLGDQVMEVNYNAAQIARKTADEAARKTYVAGSVGSLGTRMRPYGRITEDESRAAFTEQISALIDGGVDVLLFETFTDHNEMLLALETARSVSPSTPVICSMTFAQDDRTMLGFTPARVAHELHKAGADVIGVNCSTGPAQISIVLQAMHKAVPEAHFIAMPNAGFPEFNRGRVMYPATADYFGDYALTFKAMGANIIGGCCGTTPDHIRAMRTALDEVAAHKRQLPHIQVMDTSGDDSEFMPLPPTTLADRLSKRLFTVTVEMAPPRSANIDKLLNNARILREAGADLLDIADTPAARMRMSPWAVCHELHAQVGLETVLHFPTRGRNLLRIQGDLLAAHALDLRNLFVTMGDPTKIGDYPEAMDQYDIVPSKLIELIKTRMNDGMDMAGSSIGRPTAFTVGCALNMFADDLDREIKVLGNKLSAGADFALGQAVFEAHKIDLFLERYEETNGHAFDFPVLMGIMPLYSLRQAQFLHNEVPGISIPDHIFKRMEDAGDDAPYEGVKIAQELLIAVREKVAGAYIIPAFGRYELAAEVVSAIAVPS